MNCPECHAPSKVLDSRNKPEYLYRRRECLECGERFSTHETLVITRSGARNQHKSSELSVQEELDKLIKEQAADDKRTRVYSNSLDKLDQFGRSQYDTREGYG